MTDQEHLQSLIDMGEAAYDRLYDAHSHSDATMHYSDTKEFFYDAIALARQLGDEEKARQIEQRLQHIKAVFRSQFT